MYRTVFTRTASEGYGPWYGREYVSTSNTVSSTSLSFFTLLADFPLATDFEVRTYGGEHPRIPSLAGTIFFYQSRHVEGYL